MGSCISAHVSKPYQNKYIKVPQYEPQDPYDILYNEYEIIQEKTEEYEIFKKT